MTTMLTLSMAGLSWLGAGVVLWGIFVALDLRFEPRHELLSAPGTRRASDHGFSPAAEVARS